ncbi:MAG: Hsp20 family protein [Rhodobacteraceae bacterium]|nr:Hsp20 family protein [Paracoccaceae bacterium]
MRALDLSPLYRATVGFDNLSRVFDSVTRFDDAQTAYPPYNIAKSGEDAYRVTLAVAGFGADDIDIQVENNTLTVKGRTAADAGDVTYLHRGIAGRAFERRFELADHIQVVGARMENGLLHVDLKREIPEALKPRRIAINASAQAKPTLVEGSAKAA